MSKTPIPAALLALAALSPVRAAERVCLEAEHAESIEPPMEIVHVDADADADQAVSGNAYLQIARGKGNPPEMPHGAAEIAFSVREAGEYRLWCRVWWTDGCGNSFTVRINDGKPFSFGLNSVFRRWHWVSAPPRLPQLKLEPGTHRLRIENREDGVRIDQILLTNDRRFVPVGIERITRVPE